MINGSKCSNKDKTKQVLEGVAGLRMATVFKKKKQLLAKHQITTNSEH